MILSEEFGRLADARADWFAGLDERLPVPLLRHVADRGPSALGNALSAVMEIACRRTVDPSAAPAPVVRARRAGRRAVIEPCVLPRDVGSRFLDELRDLVAGESCRYEGVRARLQERLGADPSDTNGTAEVLSGALACSLDLPVPASRAALAVALTVIGANGWAAWCGPASYEHLLPVQADRRHWAAASPPGALDGFGDGPAFTRGAAAGIFA